MNLVRCSPHWLREKRIAELVEPYTLVGRHRIRNLYALARQIDSEQISGDVVECGVCNGGTAAVLAHLATHSLLDRTVWLLDSFQGMPETTEEDGEEARAHIGKEVGDVTRVNEVLRLAGADISRVRIVAGWFQETFPSLRIPRIALLNIDVDWYESVKLCLESFYDLVVPRGFVSIDDYGHWLGCQKAVDEFFRLRGLHYALRRVDYTARWFQKL